jgi:hypothetical protein
MKKKSLSLSFEAMQHNLLGDKIASTDCTTVAQLYEAWSTAALSYRQSAIALQEEVLDLKAQLEIARSKKQAGE